MKVYISGKITGLPYEEARRLFQQAEDYLHGLGYETVNPLDNGLELSADWIKHIIRDIELLNECDAVYMLDNWLTSPGATIEKEIAEMTNKKILFQNHTEGECYKKQKLHANLLKIKGAIEEVTGLNFKSYTTKSRDRRNYFARLIFTQLCRETGLNTHEIARLVNRDNTTIIHCIRKFVDEYNFNPSFNELVETVKQRLTEC